MTSDIVKKYNELRKGTHTCAEAFRQSMVSNERIDRYAYGMIALAVQTKLVESGKLLQEDATKIADAMIEKIAEKNQDGLILLNKFQNLLITTNKTNFN